MDAACSNPEGVVPATLKERLINLWSRRELEMLRQVAYGGFSLMAQPLEGLLTVLEGCHGNRKGKGQTLRSRVIMEFKIWMEDHPQATLAAVPADQVGALQRRALELTDDQANVMDTLLDIYQLHTLDRTVLLQHVIKLQSLRCYNEAAQLATKLKLQKELDMDKMCVPLILMDKLPLAECFVMGHCHLEQHLVSTLDAWCSPGFDVRDIHKLFPNLHLPEIVADRINPKILSKQIFRLMEKFNIDPALCPNSVQKRKRGTLHFLIINRFVKKTMTEENWCDHVQLVVADDPEMQASLVAMLAQHSSAPYAAKWALKYNVPRDRLSLAVQEAGESLSPHLQQWSLGTSPQMEEWVPPQTHCDRFYQLPLPRERVHFLDTPEGLEGCQQAVLKDGAIVGVDMEWRGGFGSVFPQRVALIQLAVADQVFILDLCASGLWQHHDTLCFIRALFSAKRVMKLAYDTSGDLKCLLATWPQFSEQPLKTEKLFDLHTVHKKMQCGGASKAGADPSERGLSLLVHQVLGKPLDKSEQLSYWERRPLRLSQVRYAAADAFCLMGVYSALSSNPESFGLSAKMFPSFPSASS